MHSKTSFVFLIALIVSPSLAQPSNSIPICQNSDLRVLSGDGGTPCAVINTILNGLQFLANVPPARPEGYELPSNFDFPLVSEPMCTTEMYNLVQGCAACQQASTTVAEQLRYPSLSDWMRRCTENGIRTNNNADLASFVTSRVLPSWAQTPPAVGDTFNVQNLLSTLPAAPIPGLTLSFSHTTPPISAESPTSSPAPDAESPSVAVANSSSLPIGAVVGGVVGGIVFLLLVGGLIFWFCRRNRSRSHLAPSSEFANARHIPLAQDDDDDREMSGSMRQRHSLTGDAPPAFTPGQFKDPIFEKGVAISTGAVPISSVTHSATTSFSPVSPSSAQQGPLQQPSGDQYQPSADQYQPSADQYQSSADQYQSSADQYQSSADAYPTSASHQYHSSSMDQYHSSIDQYRTDVHPHSPHSPEMTQGYRD